MTPFFSSSWTLLNNDGDRTTIKHINFKNPFIVKPQVITSLNNLDVDKDRNLRIKVSPLNVTENGFDIEFRTYSDTRIFSAGVVWFAHESEDKGSDLWN